MLKVKRFIRYIENRLFFKFNNGANIECIHELKYKDNPTSVNALVPQKVKSVIESASKWGDVESCHVYSGFCTIEPDFGWAITSNHRIIKESLLHTYVHLKSNPSFKPSYIKYRMRENKSQSYDSAIVLMYGSNNYWHFFNDIVGMLHLADDLSIPKDTPIIVHESLKSRSFFKQLYQIAPELMDRSWVGIKPRQYINIKRKSYFLTSAWGKTTNFTKTFDLFKNITLENAFDKIFISRKLTDGRTANNIKEIEEYVNENGFQVIHCEKFTLEQQRSIFRNARICIAIHGAALTNIYHTENSKLKALVEIFPEDYINPCYYWPANLFQIAYYSILGGKMSANRNFDFDLNDLKSYVNGDYQQL